MLTRAFLVVSLFLAFSLKAKTNVVVFLTDDQGWGDLSQRKHQSVDSEH